MDAPERAMWANSPQLRRRRWPRSSPNWTPNQGLGARTRRQSRGLAAAIDPPPPWVSGRHTPQHQTRRRGKRKNGGREIRGGRGWWMKGKNDTDDCARSSLPAINRGLNSGRREQIPMPCFRHQLPSSRAPNLKLGECRSVLRVVAE